MFGPSFSLQYRPSLLPLSLQHYLLSTLTLPLSAPLIPTNPLPFPQAPKPTTTQTEAPGPIASDSLAAESLSSGGVFASGNAKASSDTGKANDENADSTTVIPAAASKSQRGVADSGDGAKSGSGSAGNDISSAGLGSTAGGSVSFTGAGAGAGAASSSSTSGASNNASSTNASSTSSATSSSSSTHPQSSKPAGANITEGGFDSSAPNASFSGDIGGENDPGRVAEQGMANRAAGQFGSGDGGNKICLLYTSPSPRD